MFQSLSGGFVNVFQRLRRRGVVTEKEIEATVRDMRVLLLEADVALSVVRRFVDSFREHVAQQKLEASTAPEKLLFKIAHERMIDILQGRQKGFFVKPPLPAPILLVGLQGSGKTTTCIKLARYLQRRGKKRLAVVSLDVHRPAAREQLAKMAAAADIPLIAPESSKARDIAVQAFNQAEREGYDALLLDSAGRTHVDVPMMDELTSIVEAVPPRETLLVVDAAMGQSALGLIEAFRKAVNPKGSIVTRMDGDARGGAMLSLASSECPVLFTGHGENVDDFEEFDSARMASRILARPTLGDIAELIGNDGATITGKKKSSGMVAPSWTFETLYQQLVQLEKVGGMSKLKSVLASGLSGMMANKAMKMDLPDTMLKRQKAIIESMTVMERRHPECIKASRKQRIGNGSGTTVQEINQLIQQFRQMSGLMKKLGKKKKFGPGKGFSPLSQFGL